MNGVYVCVYNIITTAVKELGTYRYNLCNTRYITRTAVRIPIRVTYRTYIIL